jgi:N6-L-threonylcarbamoyladenine synthase
MLILGIESSCDETAASVVCDSRQILSSAVASQDQIHSKFGGVVPELASRRHIETIIPIISKALADSGKKIDEIDALAVTKGPGLVGSLLIGISAAKSIAFVKKIPIIGVNHLQGHLVAALLEENRPEWPAVGLIVSGGHTNLYFMKGPDDIKLLGKTRDDAAGEAFDKVAKLLELGYPGGIQIEKLSKGVDPHQVKFTKPLMEGNPHDFSFSGLKTAVLNLYKSYGDKAGIDVKKMIAAAFQETVAQILVSKLLNALKSTGSKNAIICGGVAANQRLRDLAISELGRNGYKLFIPRKSLCTDNAAMIAACGFIVLNRSKSVNLSLNAESNLEIG